MSEQNLADDAVDSDVPNSLLIQGNPDCSECASAISRSQRRWRERNEAIRQSERLQNCIQQETARHKNSMSITERKIQRLEQDAANRSPTESTISLEEHNKHITEKVTECQAKLREVTSEIRKALNDEKATLVEQLDSEKKQRQVLSSNMTKLLEEVTELRSLNNVLGKELKNTQEERQKLEEENSKLLQEVSQRDKEIVWLKEQMARRAEEHKLAISPRKVLLNEQQQALLSGQQPSTPASRYKGTITNPSNMTGGSPLTMAPPLRTPSKRNGFFFPHPPFARTPQHGRQLSKANGKMGISVSTELPPNGFPSCSSSVTSQNNMRSSGARQNGTNTPATPSIDRQNMMTFAVTPQQQYSPVGLNPKQETAFIAGYVHDPFASPSMNRQRMIATSATQAPALQKIFLSDGNHSSASQVAMPRSVVTPASIIQTPQEDVQLTVEQRQGFEHWLAYQISIQAAHRRMTHQEKEDDILILSIDPTVRNQAVRKALNKIMRTQGADAKSNYLQVLQQLQQQSKQRAAQPNKSARAFPHGIQLNTQNSAEEIHPQNSAPSAAQVNAQSDIFHINSGPIARNDAQNNVPPSPRHSPRLQASNNLPNAAQIRNPTQQPPPLTAQDAFQALNTNAMRQTSAGSVLSMPDLPQKQKPNTEWNLPVNKMDIFQGTMPMLPMPGKNASFQHSDKQDYQFIYDDLEILGTNSIAKGMNQSLDSNSDLVQSSINDQLQNGINEKLQNNQAQIFLSQFQQYDTQTHPSRQHSVAPQLPLHATDHDPFHFPSPSSARVLSRAEQPNGIPDGGYRGIACTNCHHEWWNTWCDDNPNGCFNCQQEGQTCKRPACPNFDNCQNTKCRNAHAVNGFPHPTLVKTKKTMKRKNKKTDEHTEPPRKRMVGAQYPGLRA